MTAARNGLLTGLLVLACLLGLQATFLLRQMGVILNQQNEALLSAIAQSRGTLAFARSVLEEQRGYYRDSARHVKALTKAAAIDAIRLGRLLEKIDERTERLTLAAERAIQSAQGAAETAGGQTAEVGERAAALLEQATATVGNLDQLAAAPALAQSLENLEASTANLATATAAAAQAAESIRDMLSPTKKSFWRRLLELMIPRPTVRVK